MTAIAYQVRPATDAQHRFLMTLARDHVLDSDTRETFDHAMEHFHMYSTREASALIDAIKGCPAKARPAAADAPEGMHRLAGNIFKVQRAVHGNGNLYAKALLRTGDTWTFSFAPGMVRRLSAATLMSLAEAKEFGALYGTCCVCGRTLTDEDSIAAGIGPICAKKF